jgi:hypothetical protein
VASTCRYLHVLKCVCVCTCVLFHSPAIIVKLLRNVPRKFFTCFWSTSFSSHCSLTVMSFPFIPSFLLLAFSFLLFTSSFSFFSSSLFLRFTPIIPSSPSVYYSNVLCLCLFQLFTTPSSLTVLSLTLNAAGLYYSHLPTLYTLLYVLISLSHLCTSTHSHRATLFTVPYLLLLLSHCSHTQSLTQSSLTVLLLSHIILNTVTLLTSICVRVTHRTVSNKRYVLHHLTT